MDKAAIAAMIPHAGTMCLLDRIDTYDAIHLKARALGQRAVDHPLRHEGRLGALCGIEYAAQAMAAHGRLSGAVAQRPRMGFLIGLRGVACQRDFIDDCAELIIAVEQLMGDDRQVIYQFAVTGDGAPVISGRATVILDGEPA